MPLVHRKNKLFKHQSTQLPKNPYINTPEAIVPLYLGIPTHNIQVPGILCPRGQGSFEKNISISVVVWIEKYPLGPVHFETKRRVES